MQLVTQKMFSLQAKVNYLKKIKIGAVNYLNTKPLIYGLQHSAIFNEIELQQGFPAKIAHLLLNDEIDIGLVPIAILPSLKYFEIITDYCIGATQSVASVCLFSDVPIEKIKVVLLDYQSKTSVALCKILFKHYWKKQVVFKEADEHFTDTIKGSTAAVVIGDRAFEQRNVHAYIYDLASEWIAFTGLPFVFATWVANKKIEHDFLMKFNEANSLGLQHFDDVIATISNPLYNMHTYFNKNISYIFDENKKEGLKKFLNYLIP